MQLKYYFGLGLLNFSKNNKSHFLFKNIAIRKSYNQIKILLNIRFVNFSFVLIMADLKKVILQFMVRLKRASTDLDLETAILNTDFFYEQVYELGRHMNLSSEYKSLFSEEDKQTLVEIFPKAFVLLAAYTHSLMSNMDDDDFTFAKVCLSNIAFFKNEILNFYKELSGNVELSEEMNNSISDLDDLMDRIETDVAYWSKQDNVEDYLDYIPNLNGVPESHYWWTEENRLYSKNKFK